MKKPYESNLNSSQEWFCLIIGIILASMVVFSAGLLIFLQEAQLPIMSIHCKVMLWSCGGGLLGGSARALFTFKHQMAGWGHLNSEHLKLWFLYLVKPFIGIAGGLFFLLLVNLGIVSLYTGTLQPEKFELESAPSLQFFRVALTSVIGGMYFENVFGILLGMVPSRDRPTDDGTPDRPSNN